VQVRWKTQHHTRAACRAQFLVRRPGPAPPRTNSKYPRLGWAARLLISPCRAPPWMKKPPLDCALRWKNPRVLSRRRSTDPHLSPSRSAHHWHSASGVHCRLSASDCILQITGRSIAATRLLCATMGQKVIVSCVLYTLPSPHREPGLKYMYGHLP